MSAAVTAVVASATLRLALPLPPLPAPLTAHRLRSTRAHTWGLRSLNTAAIHQCCRCAVDISAAIAAIGTDSPLARAAAASLALRRTCLSLGRQQRCPSREPSAAVSNTHTHAPPGTHAYLVVPRCPRCLHVAHSPTASAAAARQPFTPHCHRRCRCRCVHSQPPPLLLPALRPPLAAAGVQGGVARQRCEWRVRGEQNMWHCPDHAPCVRVSRVAADASRGSLARCHHRWHRRLRCRSATRAALYSSGLRAVEWRGPARCSLSALAARRRHSWPASRRWVPAHQWSLADAIIHAHTTRTDAL